MRFNEFKPIKYVTPDELVDKGVAGVKSLAKKTVSGTAGALGAIGKGTVKGIAKTVGAVLPDFDPAATTLTKGLDSDNKNNTAPKTAAFQTDRKTFKNALKKSLNNEPLSDQEIKHLRIGLENPWIEEMQTPEFQTALKKLIQKQTLSGSELVLLKTVYAKTS